MPTATDTDIGNAIVAAIQGIGLVTTGTTVLDSARVVFRKRPELAPKEEPPLVIVVVNETPDEERIDARTKLNKWQCAVVIVAAGGEKLEDDSRSRYWRRRIVETLYDKQRTAFAGIAGFNEANTRGRTPFDPAALSKALNWLVVNLEVQTLHTLAT